MDHQFHFIYKTTNSITGKFYIGMHSTNVIDDGYKGSGIHIARSLKKYGKHNHTLEIIEMTSDRDTLSIREAQIVNEELLRDPQCMNLKCGGIGGYGMRHTEESKQKISASRKGKGSSFGRRMSDETRKKISKSWEERVVSEETKELQSLAHRGIMHSHETRAKISAARKSKMPLHGKPVMVDGREFQSVFCASDALDLPMHKIVYRIKSTTDKFANTHYI